MVTCVCSKRSRREDSLGVLACAYASQVNQISTHHHHN
jgi:hypothetical protein